MNKQTLRSLGTTAEDRARPDAYAYADSDEHREGIRAFLEKRRPRF